MTTMLVVPWATLAVKTTTIGRFALPMVQLVSLEVDYMENCLAQLIPAVVLVAVLGACKTSRMPVVSVVAAVGLDQLLQMLTLVVVIG